MNGLTLAEAADELKAAHFALQPAAVERRERLGRHPPGPDAGHQARGRQAGHARGREAHGGAHGHARRPTPTADARPRPRRPTATATPTPTPTGGRSRAPSRPPPVTATTANGRRGQLPKDLVFASATSGQLYRWASADAKATRLTSPKLRLETPTPIDDGFAAVQVDDGGRTLVRGLRDGKTITPLAEGDFHRPAFSPARGLLAAIDAGGRGDAGRLCALDPQDPDAPTCAPGRRVGRPAWAPNGRSLLALAASSTAARSCSATRPAAATRALERAEAGLPRGGHPSAAWLGDDRVARSWPSAGATRTCACSPAATARLATSRTSPR